MEDDQVVSIKMIVAVITTLLLGFIAAAAENLPIAGLVVIILLGLFAGLAAGASKAAGRLMLNPGVLFFMWLLLSIITGGFICGAALVGTFVSAQCIIRVKLDQLDAKAREAKAARIKAEQLDRHRHDHYHHNRRKRRKRNRGYDQRNY